MQRALPKMHSLGIKWQNGGRQSGASTNVMYLCIAAQSSSHWKVFDRKRILTRRAYRHTHAIRHTNSFYSSRCDRAVARVPMPFKYLHCTLWLMIVASEVRGDNVM